MSIEPQSHRQIIALDAIRFLAAALVMILHLGFWSWWPSGGSIRQAFPALPAYPELISVSWFGWIGVEIFFVLSGLVIAYSAERATPWSFVRSRAVRLLPGVWICATLTALVLVVPLGVSEVATRWINTVIMSPLPHWVDGVYWSLIVELTFYGGVFLALFLGRLRWLGHGMAAVGLASSAYAIASLFLSLPHGTLITYTLIEHGMHFAIGVVLWLGLIKGRRRWLWLLLPLTAGAIAEIVGTAQRKMASFGIDELVAAPVLVWAAAMGMIIASVVFNPAIHGRFGQWAGVSRKMGLATYPLYLTHGMIGGFVINLSHDHIGRWPALLLGMAVAICVSLAVAICLEPPVQKLLKEGLSRTPQRSDRAVRADA